MLRVLFLLIFACSFVPQTLHAQDNVEKVEYTNFVYLPLVAKEIEQQYFDVALEGGNLWQQTGCLVPQNCMYLYWEGLSAEACPVYVGINFEQSKYPDWFRGVSPWTLLEAADAHIVDRSVSPEIRADLERITLKVNITHAFVNFLNAENDWDYKLVLLCSNT